MSDEQSLKRAKKGEDGTDIAVASDVFTLPEDKPDLADLRLEPKEYFKFMKSQKKHLSLRESDGQAGASFSCTTMRMVTK